MVSTFEGTLTAGPCTDRCLPLGSATIVMKGTRKQINLNSNAFRPERSGGSSHNYNPLALACNGRSPFQGSVIRFTITAINVAEVITKYLLKHISTSSSIFYSVTGDNTFSIHPSMTTCAHKIWAKLTSD